MTIMMCDTNKRKSWYNANGTWPLTYKIKMAAVYSIEIHGPCRTRNKCKILIALVHRIGECLQFATGMCEEAYNRPARHYNPCSCAVGNWDPSSRTRGRRFTDENFAMRCRAYVRVLHYADIWGVPWVAWNYWIATFRYRLWPWRMYSQGRTWGHVPPELGEGDAHAFAPLYLHTLCTMCSL